MIPASTIETILFGIDIETEIDPIIESVSQPRSFPHNPYLSLTSRL